MATVGAYFGQDVRGIVERLLAEQLPDGGWNCEAENGSTRSSFNTTICVLEALLEHELYAGSSPQVTAARLTCLQEDPGTVARGAVSAVARRIAARRCASSTGLARCAT